MRARQAWRRPLFFAYASTVFSLLFSPLAGVSADAPKAAQKKGPSPGERLFGAVIQSNVDQVKAILDERVDVNARRFGMTPLHTAQMTGNTEIEKLLLSRGADASIPFPAPQSVAEQVFTELVRTNGAGLALLVARDGKILFQKAAGLANLDPQMPLGIDSQFRIGSVTKQFVAAGILKLQEQGKLSVRDKLSKFYPGFPRGDEVTIHHLLTHTSGIHSYTSKPDFMARVTNSIAPAELIAWFRDDPYDFSPGDKFTYNNSGYFLLGEIIGKASGKPWGEFLKAEFFTPLGMKSTGVYTNGVALPREALGHSWTSGTFKRAVDWDMSWAGGAGALYSTVGDLQRWADGIAGGRVLKEESLKAAWTPAMTAKNTDQPETGYGYGWTTAKLRGVRVVEHSGGLHGFSSMLKTLPDQKGVIAVLANSLPPGPGLEPSELARRFALLFFWREMKPVEAPKLDTTVNKAAYDALVGRYNYGSAVMTVTREGDRLMAQLTGQPRYEIFPKSETEFFWKVVEASVRFIKDKDGKVLHALHNQGGIEFEAPRMPDLKDIKAAPEDLEAYVGRYQYGPVVGTVTRDGGRLFMQISGQPRLEIFPEEENKFSWREVAATITFVRDAKGKVIKGIHEQGGQTIEVNRLE